MAECAIAAMPAAAACDARAAASSEARVRWLCSIQQRGFGVANAFLRRRLLMTWRIPRRSILTLALHRSRAWNRVQSDMQAFNSGLVKSVSFLQ